MIITLNVDPTEEKMREAEQGIADGTYKMDQEGNINALPIMIERVLHWTRISMEGVPRALGRTVGKLLTK